METWIWISLYIVQTFVGAVLWRRFTKGNKNADGFSSFVISAMMLPNILFVILGVFGLISNLVDFLADVK